MHSKCTEYALALSTVVAQGMVNPDCDDSAPDADMGEEEWDYAYPGCEMDEDWNGAMAPRVAPPDAATIAAPSAAPTGKALRFLTLSLIVSGTQPPFPSKHQLPLLLRIQTWPTSNTRSTARWVLAKCVSL